MNNRFHLAYNLYLNRKVKAEFGVKKEELMEVKESSWEETDEPSSSQLLDNVLSSRYIS